MHLCARRLPNDQDSRRRTSLQHGARAKWQMRVAYAACAHVGEQILKVLRDLQGRTVDEAQWTALFSHEGKLASGSLTFRKARIRIEFDYLTFDKTALRCACIDKPGRRPSRLADIRVLHAALMSTPVRVAPVARRRLTGRCALANCNLETKRS